MIVAGDLRLVGVRIDEHVEVALVPLCPGQSVCQQETRAVAGTVTERRLAERSDNLDAAEQSNFVALVVAEAADERAIELPQWRHGKRRDEVARKQNQFDLFVVEELDSSPQVVKVIMDVSKNSDTHFGALCDRREGNIGTGSEV